jgi:hypothetical protein
MEHRVEVLYRQEHAEKPVIVRSGEDVDELINALLAGPAYHNLAQLHSMERPMLPSGYPDHELLMGIDASLRVGVLAFMDAEVGNVVTLGPSEGRGEVSYFIMGQVTEFPDRSEIPIEFVGRAVKEFLVFGGQRPACVQWQVPEVW